MKKILFIFALFFSGYAFSGECIILDENGKQTPKSCSVELLGGGGNWISKKIMMVDRQFYLLIGDCVEDSKGDEVCANIQLSTDERDLVSDKNSAFIFSLDRNMRPIRYDSVNDWTCLKREDKNLNVCYKEE